MPFISILLLILHEYFDRPSELIPATNRNTER